MGKSVAISWSLFGLAVFLGALGAWWLLSAVTTAHLRFGHCGPSTLDHVEAYCQVATKLLYSSWALLAGAALLVGCGIFVRRRHRPAA